MDRELIYEELLWHLKAMRTSVDRDILMGHEDELLVRVSAYADAVAHDWISPLEARFRLERYINSFKASTEQSDSGVIKY